jgi:hypothetical protein
MGTMTTNTLRIGNFTSSEIGALMSDGKAKGTLGKTARTYIDECNMERELGRSLSEESNARPLNWGRLLEKRVFSLLPMDYVLMGDETFQHPEFECWTGSPDALKHDTVVDVKCPITLKSFCNLVRPLYDGFEGMDAMNLIRENHKDGEKYYWQLVSNGIITGSKYAELIVYVPYLEELMEIKALAIDSDETQKLYWLINADNEELPYLINGKKFKNISIIRFEIPQADKDALTERVITASKMLIK